MGPKKLWRQQEWEKWIKRQKKRDFPLFLLTFAWYKPFSQRKFNDIDLHLGKNLQGI